MLCQRLILAIVVSFKAKHFKLLLDLFDPFVLVSVSDVAIFQVGNVLTGSGRSPSEENPGSFE